MDDVTQPHAPETARWAPLPGPFGRVRALRSLNHPGYRRLWTAGLLLGFGNWMQRLTIGWLVLDQTGSIFLTALSFAVRSAPNVLFGLIGGSLADRVDRRRLLVLASAIKLGIAVVLGVLVLSGHGSVWPILALVAVGGITMTFEIPAAQALVVDLVGRRDAASGIALFSVATRLVGAVASVTGGVLIAVVGPGPVFLLGAAAFAAGGLAVATVRAPAAPRRPRRGNVASDALDGLRVMLGIPVVATLIALAVLAEIFGFSYQSVMPAVAEGVLGVGPAGLGALTAMAGIGGFVGSMTITVLADFARKGLLITVVTIGYGVALLALASSSLFPVSLVIVLGVGVMAAGVDALQWTLLQANVPDEMRGRAVGGWIFAIGFGWVGALELGALGEALGVQAAIAINGAVLAAVGVGALAFARRLRRA